MTPRSASWAHKAMDIKQLLSVLIVVAGLCCEIESARIRKNSNKAECNDKQQSLMQAEFNECLQKFTQTHHENMGKAVTQEDYQVSDG